MNPPTLTIPAQTWSPQAVIQADAEIQQAQGYAIPVQNSPQSARAVHKLIEAMPSSQEDLEVIERRSQLMNTRENITRMHIADPSIIDVVQYSPKEIAIMGLVRGSTTLTMWFENHNEPLIYLVKTIRDPSYDQQRRGDYGKLERKINTLFPNSKVYLIPLSWKIIVRGQARDQEEAAHILSVIRGEVLGQDWGGWAAGTGGQTAGGYGAGVGNGDAFFGGRYGLDFGNSFIINELRVPGEFQIQLRVRVAQLNRSELRQQGIDLAVLFNNARHSVFTSMGAASGATLGGIFENGEIGVFLNWAATNQTAKILTEPNVVVLSGRPARFLAGGEFAVPTTVGIGGAAGVTTSFRGFGTSLFVTPAVVDRDQIRVQAIAEYSDLNTATAVGGIPGTNTRRVETTVEMREGQTLALGGLLSNQTRVTQTRIPFLGDIPKVGPLLFSTKQSSQDETELLILITPEIVRPMDPHEVPPVPGFEVTHPMDHEFYCHNMTEGAPDTGYYQLPPYGSGSVGTNVGYQHFNPGPAGSMYSPVPTNPNGTGFSTPMMSPTPIGGGIPSGPGTAAPPNYIPPMLPPAPQQPIPQGVPSVMNRPGQGRPVGGSQTIVPANHTSSSSRISRDSQRSSRY